jgi:hypothetical protein
MKTFEEDIKLKQLLKSIKLDEPASDFKNQVMNRVFQEHTLQEQIKAEPLLGKGFWIILALFGILMAAIGFFGSGNLAVEPVSILPDFNSFEFMSDYRSLFGNLDKLPASMAGILIAFSLLIFLERFLSIKKPGLA